MSAEDKDAARRLAEKDFRMTLRGLKSLGIPQSVALADDVDTAPIDAETLVILTMPRDALTKHTARLMGETFREARARAPQSPVYLMFVGYDDDPRGLWQFPEVRRYLKWWARFAGISDWGAAAAVPWAHPSWGIALLVACGVFGDDHPYTVQLSPQPMVT
jgi:hypothetical protein